MFGNFKDTYKLLDHFTFIIIAALKWLYNAAKKMY